MRIIATECSEALRKEDMPLLKQYHDEMMESSVMWPFFGGLIELPNGNQYQVVN